MVTVESFETKEEWLKKREGRIGGSDASSVIGMNPYRSNVDLWRIKTGIIEQEDISNKDCVRYGTEAEQHLRELFKLDFPQYAVFYIKNNMYLNDKYPFAHASLDGILRDEKHRNGILEIKTTNIKRSKQKESWDKQIPQNYYIQLLHYLMVTEFDFAVLKAQLKYEFDDDVFCQTRHYKIERKDVESDIEYLKNKEIEFFNCVKNKIKPDLILPKI
jgi:putative phage-type endonuclease